MPKTVQNSILQRMLGGMDNLSTDTPHALDEPQGFGGIPEDILYAAEQMYLEQYGEEGFGGDASMEMVEKIAREMMAGSAGPNSEMTKDGGMDQAMALRDKLGGDLDDIEHLLPPEYMEAIELGDDDTQNAIINDFITSNPDIIQKLIKQKKNALPVDQSILRKMGVK